MPRTTTDVLEWHRVSVLWRVVALWAVAVAFVLVGMVGTGLHLFAPPSVPADTRMLGGLLGWPAAVLGPVLGIIGVLRVLSGEDRALVVCQGCLRLEGFGPRAPIPWGSLDGMHVEGRWPRHRLVLTVSDASRTTRVVLPGRWMGLSARRLCERVLEIRRRALLGVPDRLPAR